MVEKENKKTNYTGIMLVTVGLVILATLVWAFIVNNNRQAATVDDDGRQRSRLDTEKPSIGEEHINTERPLSKVESSSEASIEKLIPRLKSYGLDEIAKDWRGKEAPDFALKDLNGKTHKLSDYRGRDVIVTFWATWCPPCQAEIPDLIQLRKEVPEDKLAILTISDESLITLETFSEKMGINYTVLQMPEMLGRPYNLVRYIPSTFFISPDGRIKLAVTGVTTNKAVKAIMNAR
ncbi:MAG: TlpA family protein disulfide reductase [Sedimentisphaerales bacterium]|nr:TlpA family protein disulfide reductase [Sedimentisphaerales bacterium]